MLELLHENRSVLMIRGGTPEARNPHRAGQSAPLRRARRLRPHGLRRHRQRAARRDAHLGPDRLLRSERAARRQRGRRQQRRLDDEPAADQGVPPDSAGEHPGDLHAHAARATTTPAKSSSSRATKAITSTSSSRARCAVTRETPLNQRRHQARGARHRRHVRRGSADLGRQAQRHRQRCRPKAR